MSDEIGEEIPQDVEDRLRRGKSRLDRIKPERNECMKFWRGEQYVHRTSNGLLVNQSTLVGEGARPSHRPRQVRNLLIDIVRHEVSAATSRVPGYEIDPSTTDPEDISAARLAGKVARFGYDKWGVQEAIESAVTFAVVADEAFIWPYWDATQGAVIDEDGTCVGDVKLRVFSGNEVYWEPGVRFENSSWWCVQQARPIPDVEAMPGYYESKISLTPDATTDDTVGARAEPDAKLVLVTEYLERPSTKRPKGRRFVIANKRIVCKPEAYPNLDAKGEVCDEPVLHKLSYIVDPGNDRDMGLIRHCLDAQRTYNDCVNKQIQWKQMALNPQVVIKNGKFLQKLTDVPGAVFEFVGSGDVKWRQVPDVPADLENMKNGAKSDIGNVAAQNDIPAQVEAGKAIEALSARDATARGSFIARLAMFHSAVMRQCLSLVSLYYTEPRLLRIRGRFGPELIQDFKGAQLRSQVDVTVLPGDLFPMTRDQIQAKLTWIATTFPGYLDPVAAIAALDGGTAEKLIQSYELDVARANSIIQKIKAGPQAFMTQPLRLDSKLGMEVPGWMPREVDDVDVHKSVFGDFMKTQDYDDSPPDIQEAITLYYEGLNWLEQQKAQQAAIQQTQMAEQLGAANAAAPQGAKPAPDMPGGSTPQPPQPLAAAPA